MGASSFGIKPMEQIKNNKAIPQKRQRRRGIRRTFVLNFFAMLTLATIVTILCEVLVIMLTVAVYNTQLPRSSTPLLADDKQFARTHARDLLTQNQTVLREWHTRMQQVQETHYVFLNENGQAVEGGCSLFLPSSVNNATREVGQHASGHRWTPARYSHTYH